MRIGVDCRLSGPQHAGIGRYISNLIARLPVLDPDSTWIYFAHDLKQLTEVAHLPNVKIIVAPVKHYSLAEQLQMPDIFRQANLDLLHVPHFNVPLWYQGKLVITIHDLLWHEYRGTEVTTLPKTKYWLKYWGYRMVAGQAIHKAEHIFVPTQVIKDIIGQYYPDDQSKVEVTLEGVSAGFSQTLTAGSQLPEKRKSLLYVGSLYPHKNVSLIIQALAQLPEYQLVLAGARNVFQDQVKALATKHKVADQVTYLGYVRDEELVGIMQKSWALVQPSLSEGFGLTGIEAMAASTPVLASQIPVFKEIYGSAATFFDPQSVDSFILALKSLTPTQRQAQIRLGLQQVKKYSWDRMAQQTLASYRQVLST